MHLFNACGRRTLHPCTCTRILRRLVWAGIQPALPASRSSARTQSARRGAGSRADGLQSRGRGLAQAGSGGLPGPHSTHAPVTAAAFTKAASEASTGSSLQTALLAAATRLTQRSAVAAAPAAGAAASGQGAGFWGANAAGSGDFWRNLTGAGGRGGGGPGGIPGGPGAGFNRSAGSFNGSGPGSFNGSGHGAFNGSAWGGPNGTHNGSFGGGGGPNGTWNGTHGSFNGSVWGGNGMWNSTYGGPPGGGPGGRFGGDGDRRFPRGPPGNGTGPPGNGTNTPTPAPSDTPTTVPTTTEASFVVVQPVGGLRRLLEDGALARPPAEAVSKGRLPYDAARLAAQALSLVSAAVPLLLTGAACMRCLCGFLAVMHARADPAISTCWRPARRRRTPRRRRAVQARPHTPVLTPCGPTAGISLPPLSAALATRLAEKAERFSDPATGSADFWAAVKEASWRLPPHWAAPAPAALARSTASRRLSERIARALPAGARWAVSEAGAARLSCPCMPHAAKAGVSHSCRSGKQTVSPALSVVKCCGDRWRGALGR